MGCFYAVQGEVRLKKTAKTASIIDELGKLCGEINVDTEDHGEEITLRLSGGQSCSYSTASDIDSKLVELSPFAVKASKIETNCDDERGHVWVGRKADVDKGESAERVAAALAAFEALKPKERVEVFSKVLAEAIKPLRQTVADRASSIREGANYLKSDDIVCDNTCDSVTTNARELAKEFNKFAKLIGVEVVDVPSKND